MDVARTGQDVLSAEELDAVVALASLAPSVHNTQPWRFTWDGASLEVQEDRERALPVVDRTGRERVLSCGAAVLHARLAFAELGFDVRTTLLPQPQRPELLARLTVVGRREASPQEHALAAAMPVRSTDRAPFEDLPVPDEVVEDLRRAAEQEGAWVRVVDERAPQRLDDAVGLQVLLAEADRRQRSDPAYRAELETWLRDGGPDGISGRVLDPTPVEQRASSWVLRDFRGGARPAAGARAAAAALDPPPAEHPLVLVLGTPGDDREDWLQAGQALARLLLLATVHRVSAQPLTQVLELPDLRLQVRHVLHVVGHPQVLLRVGYGRVAPLSRRRPTGATLTRTGGEG